MPSYDQLNSSQRKTLLDDLTREYDALKAKGLALDMSRGKPCADQLDLSTPMLTMLQAPEDCFSEDGTDCRNYGVIAGIPEGKQLMARLLDADPEDVFVFGNASLTVMHDAIARALDFGCLGSTPWAELSAVKFICPVPGYDRHFAILEQFGIQMIPVPMTDTGPDMDAVEELVAKDASVKGIWCVPKYSNPSGATYSDETVRRLASMKCAADDFRIMWDNAYCVHHLMGDEDQQDHVLDIGIACTEAGNPNRYLKFASTSKITFPGAGVSAMAASAENISEAKRLCSAQMIGHDKLNQLRHARFLDEGRGIAAHMARHGELMKPKFDLVCAKLQEELGEAGIARWTSPRGGYFVSFEGPEGTAARIVALAKEAGVVMTSAGATWPYGNDPVDSNIRIAPSLPPLEELDEAMDVFTCCVKLAALEKLAEENA